MDSNRKGAIAEAAVALEATRFGFAVLQPLAPERYDLLFELRTRFLRVQCKWGTLRDGCVRVRTAGSRHTPNGYVRSTYGQSEIDAFGIYCQELERVFLVPVEVAGGQHMLYLRVDPPKNR